MPLLTRLLRPSVEGCGCLKEDWATAAPTLLAQLLRPSDESWSCLTMMPAHRDKVQTLIHPHPNVTHALSTAAKDMKNVKCTMYTAYPHPQSWSAALSGATFEDDLSCPASIHPCTSIALMLFSFGVDCLVSMRKHCQLAMVPIGLDVHAHRNQVMTLNVLVDLQNV